MAASKLVSLETFQAKTDLSPSELIETVDVTNPESALTLLDVTDFATSVKKLVLLHATLKQQVIDGSKSPDRKTAEATVRSNEDGRQFGTKLGNDILGHVRAALSEYPEGAFALEAFLSEALAYVQDTHEALVDEELAAQFPERAFTLDHGVIDKWERKALNLYNMARDFGTDLSDVPQRELPKSGITLDTLDWPRGRKAGEKTGQRGVTTNHYQWSVDGEDVPALSSVALLTGASYSDIRQLAKKQGYGDARVKEGGFEINGHDVMFVIPETEDNPTEESIFRIVNSLITKGV